MKGNLRRLLAIFLVLMLLSADVCAIAEAVATLTLPSALQIIEEEAFAGNTSIEKVIVPDGTTEIRSRAFADSSMTELELPDSLTFIAEDAFEGCGEFALTVPENCYAYDRCVELGLIDDTAFRATVTCSADESYVGSSVIWTATAINGLAPYKYLYKLYKDGSLIATRAYSDDNTYTYAFTETGDYYVVLSIKDDNREVVSVQSDTITVGLEKLMVSEVLCDLETIQTTETATWTAAATGGQAPYAFAFTLTKNEEVVAEQAYSEAATFSYEFVDEGDYALAIKAVDDLGAESDAYELAVPVTLRPIEITSLTADVSTSQTEEAITWTVEAVAGKAPYTYAFEVVADGVSQGKNEEQAENTYSYTPELAGTYKVVAYVTDAYGNVAQLESSELAVTIKPLAVFTVTADKDWVKIGDTVTWTTTAIGGVKPLRYAFDVYVDGEELDGCAFTTNNTISYAPEMAGVYSVNALVRDAENTTVSVVGGEVIAYEQITVDSVTADVSECLTGEVVTWTANVTGGKGLITYDWYIYHGETLEYTERNTVGSVTWAPIMSGTYTAKVSVMDEDGETAELLDGEVNSNAHAATSQSDFTFTILNGTYCSLTGYTGTDTAVIIPGEWTDENGVTRIVQTIANNAFKNNKSITSVIIADSVESMGSNVFDGCSALIYVKGGAKLTNLGNYAFQNCINLKGYDFEPATTTMGSYAFYGCTNITCFEGWEGLTNVGAYSFMNNRKINSFDWPSTVKIIGANAFAECTGLTSITIPNGITSINGGAFQDCTELVNITLPEGLTTIDGYAFSGCTSLQSIHLPDSITTMNADAFYGCTKLTTVNYPKNWTTKSYNSSYTWDRYDSPFYNCPKLTSIVIPEGVTSIPAYAFQGCTNLTSIILPSTLKTIKEYAFNNCSSLTAVYIGSKVTTIGSNAFTNHNANLIIYGESGSYAETYASEQSITFSTEELPETLVTLSGRVVTNNAEGISDVTVKLYLDQYTGVDGITVYTDENGNWSYSFAKANRSYLITIEKDGYAFGLPSQVCTTGENNTSARTVYGAESSTPVASVTGLITNDAGQPIEGVDVYLVSTDDGNVSAHTAQTDENGQWQVDGLVSGQQYNVTYSTTEYMITPSSQVVVASNDMEIIVATASLAQSETSGATISFAMTDGENAVIEVPTGRTVVFDVQATNATKARLIVDGNAYESFSIMNGSAVFEREFSQAGNHEIAFQAGDENGWNELSDSVMLTVTATGGKLDTPVFVTESDQQFYHGNDITIDWNAVPNASAYSLYLYCNGVCIWHPDELTDKTSYTFAANEIPAIGNYALAVIATGYGYSQSEASVAFEVVGRTYSLTLDTPATKGTYVIGDTFYVSVSNPANAYALIQITDPDGVSVLLPESGATNSTAIEYYFSPIEIGTYSIKAFGFETANLTNTALASCSSNEAVLTVNGAKITNVNVGTGYGNMLTTEAVSAYVNTNNAVEYVEIYEGETLLTTINEYSESDYIRTFSTELTTPSAGVHSYAFRGYDAQSGDVGTRKFTFYAVEPAESKNVYVNTNGVDLLKYPVSGSETRNVSIYVSDALTLIGTCGAYSYVQFDNTKGYIDTSMISDSPVETIDGLQLSIVTPKSEGIDYIAADHSITLSWTSNIALASTMKYRFTISPEANPLYRKQMSVTTDTYQYPSMFLDSGSYTIHVELVNADGSIAYGKSQLISIYVFSNYEDYLAELNYDPLDFWVDSFESQFGVVRDAQTIFTTGTTLEDGSVAHFDLDGLTNGKMKAAYAAAVGDYSVSTEDIKVVKALMIADMLAKQYGSTSTWISYTDAKDLFSWLGIPNEIVDIMFGLQTTTGYDGNTIEPLVRTIRGGKTYIKWDPDKFAALKKSKDLNTNYGVKAVGKYLGYAATITNIIKGYCLYTSVGASTCEELAKYLRASGDTTLAYVAQYLDMMKTSTGALALCCLIQGVDYSQSQMNKAISKGGWAIAKKLAGCTSWCAFIAGAQIGAKVGQTFNKTFLNIDGIYSAAFATEYYVDAADAFYPYAKGVVEEFIDAPEANYKKMYAVVRLYGRIVSGCYISCGDIYSSLDKAWVSQFWNAVTNSSGFAQTINSCKSMASMLKDYFSHEYAGFVEALSEK